MDRNVIKFLEANKDDVKNQFDYLFIYLHGYIDSCFPQNTRTDKVIKLTKCRPKCYSLKYLINGTGFDAKFTNKDENLVFSLMGTSQLQELTLQSNKYVKPVKQKILEVDDYLDKEELEDKLADFFVRFMNDNKSSMKFLPGNTSSIADSSGSVNLRDQAQHPDAK